MDTLKKTQFLPSNNVFQKAAALPILISIFSLAATPASAHHAMGGKMPSNFFEGFMAGIAHPLIGPDHLAFIVAIGLLAAIKRKGILIPISFVLAAMLGAEVHLLSIDLPGVELLVSSSVLLFGILLALKDSPNTLIVTILSAIAGLFHGYAYGESIFGAEVTPLRAYLIGFTVIQLAVSLLAFQVGKIFVLRREADQQSPVRLRAAGLIICGVGLALFASQVSAILFPALGS